MLYRHLDPVARTTKMERNHVEWLWDRFDREKELSVGFEEFIDENGQIALPEGSTLLDHLEQHTASNGDELAYRYIDYSRNRDGDVDELTWAQFGVRLRAIAARLQQVTNPGDRVAILAPQGLDYVVSFFAAIYAGVIAVPLFDRTSRVTPIACTPSSATARPLRSSRPLRPPQACVSSSGRSRLHRGPG